MELYFTDPWNCSKNPIVSLEGKQVLKNVAVNKAVTAEVLVEDGELNLAITAPSATPCLNLCYIKIYLPKDAVVTPTPEPTVAPTATPAPTMAPSETLTPAPTEMPETTEAPAEPTAAPEATEAPAEPTADNSNSQSDDTSTSTGSKSGSSFPWVAGGAVIIGALVGVAAYFFKKKRK